MPATNQYDNYNNDFAKERGWIATRDNVIRYIRFNMEELDTPKDIHDNCPEAYGEFVEVRGFPNYTGFAKTGIVHQIEEYELELIGA